MSTAPVRLYYVLMIPFLLLQGGGVVAQEPEGSGRLLTSDPQQLLDLSKETGKGHVVTSIADFESRDIREAPAHVQVITSRQIEASGARDLYEVLQLVPGLSFGRDVDDVIGVGIHGNWAEEGKCLFLLNGRQLNENDFGTFSIAERISLANVDRIEVIMGPGTVIHGGYAALGVVNIVTRNADQGTGSTVSMQTGYSNDALTTTRTNISGAHRLDRDHEVAYGFWHSKGRRSNAYRLLPDSTYLNYADSTGIQSSNFTLHYRWRNLKASVAYLEENFEMSDAAYQVNYRNVIFGLDHRAKISQVLELSSSITHADQTPWAYSNTTEPARTASNTTNQRTASTVVLTYKPKAWISGRLGVQGSHQRSTYQLRNGGNNFRMNDSRTIAMNSVAVFTELSLKGKPGMLTGGYRLEQNNLSGQFAAPRLAYTKVFGLAHLKLLWSKAYKVPTVMNLNYGPVGGSLGGEYITTREAEVGVHVHKDASVSANIYDTRISNPIVYVFDGLELDNYVNRGHSGSSGIDVRMKLETKRTTVLLGYGMYQARTGSDLPEIQLPEELSSRFQALPSQRATAVLAWDLMPRLKIRTRATWRDRVWSYQYVQDGSLALVEWPTELILSGGLTWRPLVSDRLTVNLGCNNLLDQARTIVGPLNNGTTPFALNGREFTFGVAFRFAQ